MIISVVVPCHNVQDYIEECIESIFKQKYQHLQVICIDNCSTDNTLEILNKLASKWPIHILSENIKSAQAARNKGLSDAFGEYVQFLDADDILLPDKIMNQVRVIKNSNERPDVILGNYFQVSESSGERYKSFVKKNDLWLGLAEAKIGTTSSNLWKRETLLNAGGWDVAIQSSQDTHLIFQMLKRNCKFAISEQFDTIKRQRVSDSISKTNEAENWERFLKLRIDIINHLKKEQQDYYHTNSIYFMQPVFQAVKSIYKFNPDRSLKLYNQYFKGTPLLTNELVSWKYKIAHDLLGYSRTQKIKNYLYK